MLKLTQLKPGVLIEISNTPYQIIKSSFKMLGRGHAICRVKIKNLINSSLTEKTFKGNDLVSEAQIIRRKATYLYMQNGEYHFMEDENFSQFSLSENILGLSKNFLKEAEKIEVLYHKDEPISINLPIKIGLKVIEAQAGLRGGRETAGTKKAVLETGFALQVPLFIKEGDKIVVDTRSGEYVERVKS